MNKILIFLIPVILFACSSNDNSERKQIDKIPKFVKKYSNVKNIIDNSIKKFAKDVRLKKFPFNKNLYN